MKDLPEFQRHSTDEVSGFLKLIFTRPALPDETFFRKLVAFDDGHYRAVFSLDYLGGETASKSQWNSLKKKLKRHDKRIFVFKEHGLAACDMPDERCGYIDFGYFAH